MRLRLLTLNVWGLGGPLSRHDHERMAWIADELPRLAPDVAAFQEVWTGESRATLVRGARAAGLSHVWHRPQTWRGSGLLLASRFPLSTPRFTPFTLAGLPQRLRHADWWGRKGVVTAEISTPAGPVTLLDTHLQAQYTPGPVDEYRGHRVAQLIDIATALHADQRPVVAGGDFNLREGDGQHEILTGLSGLRDAAIVAGRRQPTTLRSNAYRRSNPDELDERIDYVFVRDGRALRVRVAGLERVCDQDLDFGGEPGAPSDHAGLVADLEIEPGASTVPAPTPEAIASARRALTTGREMAGERARCERIRAGSAAAAGAAALLGMRLTRRALLRFGLVGAAAGALCGAAGFAWLGFAFADEEQRRYQRALEKLDGLAAGAPSG
jgi:endonuclease/exonuclease/phosphatase family metal-dependent hydrolase